MEYFSASALVKKPDIKRTLKEYLTRKHVKPGFRIISIISFALFVINAEAQVSENHSPFFAKEFSKEISLYKAKAFLMKSLPESSGDIIVFEMDPLAASSSGELTSLVYNCKKYDREGLLLGFYGNYWNKEGVTYQGYNFKDLPREKALEFLHKIDKTLGEYSGMISDDAENNLFFKYDDLTVLLYNYLAAVKIRVFWNEFDAEWEMTAYKRTLKRFEKSLK